MTSDGRDPTREGSLEVPAAAVPTNRGDRRRAYGAIGVVVLVVGAAIGLSWVTGGPDDHAASTSQGRVPPSASGPAGTSTPRPPRPTPIPARIERLLDAENVPLPDAGRLLLATRRDTAADILGWAPGDAEVVLERSFASAFARVELPQLTSLAPDGRSLLVFSIAAFDEAGRDEVVLFDEGGGRAWERAGATGLSLAVWSNDSSRLAVLGDRGTWILAVRDGSAYTDRVVVVPDEPAVDSSRSLPPYDERILPIGFSDDGAWVYGAHQSVTRGIGPPFIRASVATGAVEPLASLPALGAGSFWDGSGRSIGFTLDASTPGGPPSLTVLEADGSLAYPIETDLLMGIAFAADGTVLVLEGEAFEPAGRVRLVAYDRAGRAGEPLLDVGPLTTATFVGTHGGFAAVRLATTSPERAAQLVVVSLLDGRASAVRLPVDESALVGARWLPGP